MVKPFVFFAAAAFALMLGGCAPHSAAFAPIEKELMGGNPKAALAQLDKQKPAAGDRLLHLLNRAMLLRMSGEYAASNAAFESAKKTMESFDVASVTEQAGTFILNDSTAAYAGEEFEQVFVHIYSALNYLELGDLYGARVEALQADVRLTEMALRGFKGDYREDALARYLSGVVFEALGDESDAMIAYRKAYQTYLSYEKHFQLPPPPQLKADLLRLSDRMGLKDENRRFQESFGMTRWQPMLPGSGEGEAVVIASVGLAPIKREESTMVHAASGRLVRVSLPRYETRPRYATALRVQGANRTSLGVRYHDISAVARHILEVKRPVITARAIARVIVKDNVARETEKRSGQLAGLVANIAAVMTETADTRSWLTLPDEVYIARLRLPPGVYTLEADVLGYGGGVLMRRTFEQVEIKAGKTRFFTPHFIR
ncbi:MAG: COG3014 family protein [Campylobacterales bacterium]